MKNYFKRLWKALWDSTDIDEKAEAALKEAKSRISEMKKELADVRKAAKNGDWTSMMVEYMANKSGLGALINNNSPQKAADQPETTPETTVPQPIKGVFKQ